MQPYIGMIDLFSFKFSPRGWQECNGQSVPIEGNEALYSLIGTNFGQDNDLSFSLPKLESPAPGMRYCIAMEGTYPPRG
ncbi:MAG: tail fiber protein [bacterium]|nr:tail fiber protein [bacterium]